MSPEGKSAFVRHLAIDHDKVSDSQRLHRVHYTDAKVLSIFLLQIFTYLSSEIRENMRNAFSEGPVALPPTPPPQNNLRFLN